MLANSAKRFALVTMLALVAAAGCSGSEDASATHSPGGDHPTNDVIGIDEADIVGTADGSTLTVDIPVVSLDKAATGQLSVAIRSVDGDTIHSSTKVSYDVAAKGTQHVQATFAVPPGVSKQADWVLHSLRIDDGSADGLRLTTSLLRIVSPYSLRLQGPAQLNQDKQATYRVRALNPLNQKPIANLAIDLSFTRDGNPAQKLTEKTDAQGTAVFGFEATSPGQWAVAMATDNQGTNTTLESTIVVAEPGRKVLLTSDKPLYQPGQVIHLRTLALSPPTDTPVAGENATFEVEDAKGNKIMQRDLVTDEYGIAATDFELGRILNMGTFKLRAIVNQSITEKTVEVSRYSLPKFKLGVTIDKPWYASGEVLNGTLDAGYFFGKPVANADVVLEGISIDVGETVFQTIVGKTNADGMLPFSLALPASLVGLPLEQGNALLAIRAEVTDGAGQKVTKHTPVTVAQSPLRIVAVPEATVLVPGISNQVDVFVTDPLGSPLGNVDLDVSYQGDAQSVATDEFGHAAVSFVGKQAASNVVKVTATPPGGAAISESFTFGSQSGAEHVLVRTDKSVYGLGDVVKVEVTGSEGESSVYVDWLNQGQAVDMRTLDFDSSGVAEFEMPVDGSLLGTNRVEAYVVDDDGNVIRAGRTVFVRTTSSLNVSLATDKPVYAPGEPAKLTFTVKDESDQPVVAALGIQVVDEAVFGLVDAQPGLLKTYFGLEDAYSKPQYEIQPPPGSLPDLLFQKTSAVDPDAAAAAQTAARAQLAALGSGTIVGLDLSSYTDLVAASSTLLQPFYTAERLRLVKALAPDVSAVLDELKAESCTPSIYFCDHLAQSFSQAFWLRLEKRVEEFDFWGNAYSDGADASFSAIMFRTKGPDEVASTPDDAQFQVAYSELGIPAGYTGSGGSSAGGSGGGFASGGAAGSSSGGEAGSGARSGEGPHVRKEFPETLYVNPKLITGADGKATVEVDMADSITEWRVSTLAHSAGGKLGGGVGGIKVFQDFFADVSFPATLTRGDEVEFPIAVYNYLTVPQTVTLTLAAGTWYTPLGVTSKSIDVQPGEVVGASFPVRVETVGLQTLTVTATGPQAADAVARKVLVIPDGKELSTATGGSLAPGSTTLGASFPANAVPGSSELYLEVYPAYLSQVVSGMDSMLAVPSGCFEQTTSTAWPNVLVTRYMKQTGQITPQIELKAASLMSAGYQRLLTFEHSGGGFSWFGEQDGAPFLSVTAFGLMEFADMAKMHPVDDAMIQRTQAWLLAQQKSDGSWLGDQSEFFSFQTSALRNTAFVIWALAANGYVGSEVTQAVAFVKSNLGTETDAYTLGLVANALAAAAPNDPSTSSVLADLEAKKHPDGADVHWDSEGTQTNFYASGDDAAVTATALVTHAFLLAGQYKPSVDGALSYLAKRKDASGNFGSTQATIWTLRTLLLAAEKGTEGAVGSLQVNVDGAPFTTLTLSASTPDVMTVVDMKTLASLGAHQVGLSFVGTGKLSYNLVARHNLPWSAVPADVPGPLSVTVSYDKTQLQVNDQVLATVDVVNNTASIQSMAMVTLGIPPGFVVNTEDLDAEKASGELSHYELTGKQLTLYLSELPPSATHTFVYHLVATMPVKADDGGAKAYLYYQPEKTSSAPATEIVVTNN